MTGLRNPKLSNPKCPDSPISTSRLSTSLSVAVWLTATLWLVAILARVFDAPAGIVWAALLTGLFTGFAEWLAHRRMH